MKKTVKDAYGEIMRLRNEFYQKWQETPQYDEENKYAYKAKYETFDKTLELLTPSIVDPQPEEPMTADKVNLDRCICDIDLVASAREDCERIRKHIRAIRRIFAGLPEELSHTEVTKTSDQEEPVSDDLEIAACQSFNSACEDLNKEDKDSATYVKEYFKELWMCAFKDGAHWKEQQIMKEAINGEVFDNYDKDICQHHLELLVDIPKKYKDGDKVKLIIIKER